MSKNQKIAFASMFVSFCAVGTMSLFSQGAFENIGPGGVGIFTFLYLVVGVFIYLYIKTNPGKIEKWFR
ncbi:MAG: hypothetical protein IIC10_01305 [Proteobacteria bacterium]|nr:hypothetical protein [Pseudomonadota bacterium]